MPKRPQTIEELRNYLDTHQDVGKLGGEPVVKSGSTEIRGGEIPGDIYDLALLRGAPFSFSKTDIGTHALLKYITSPVFELTQIHRLLEPASIEGRTEFRCYVPNGLYEMAQTAKAKLGWSNQTLMTVSLALFVYDPGITHAYDRFVQELAASHQVSTEEVERKIFSFQRYRAREKRLQMSLEKGEFVGDRKLP